MGDITPNMNSTALPEWNSPTLHLTQPTPEERLATWKLNGVNWGTALKPQEYLEREAHLMEVPLAREGGITHWILVDSSLPPNRRPILGSCESLRKRVLLSQNGVVSEMVTNGVGSVFCNPEYRGRKYASRMLQELGKKLKEWQADKSLGEKKCPFSILYSDIGKKYYASHGWHVFPSSHVSLPPTALPSHSQTTCTPLTDADIQPLCDFDEAQLRAQLAADKDNKVQVALIPDHDTMQWHHLRETFMTSKIFQKQPTIKGAIAGPPGSRVWAIWTRSFYGPLVPTSGNALHILRLVIEDGTPSSDNAKKLKSVLELAQHEAVKWQVSEVQFWNPTPVVKDLLHQTGLQWKEEDREHESIASLMWYGEGSGQQDEISWVANEKYGWC